MATRTTRKTGSTRKASPSTGRSGGGARSKTAARSRTKTTTVGAKAAGAAKRPSAIRKSSRAGSRTASRSPTTGASRSTAARRATGRASRSRTRDVLSLLEADHRKVRKMFRDFAKLDHDDADATRQLVEQACSELEVHATVEEEIFYPAVREAVEKQDIVEEAAVEHESARDLIDKLRRLEPGTPGYAATFTVLGEYVNHHIEEEETQMFKQARRAKLDLEALGERLRTRKEALGAGEAEGRRSGGSSRTSKEERDELETIPLQGEPMGGGRGDPIGQGGASRRQ